MSEARAGSGIVALLTHDHEVLRHLVTGFGQIDQEDWGKRFHDLTTSLLRHEVAEQRVLYPAVRTDVLPGDAVATALLAQEAEAEELLAALEKLDCVGGSFAAVLDQLQTLVLDHMRAEETILFPLLSNLENDVRQSELADRYTHAMAVAPTHPHPHAPDTPPGNAVMGAIAALFDRVRNAVHARSN